MRLVFCLTGAGCFSLVLAGCGGPTQAPPPQTPAPSAPARAEGPKLEDRNWGVLRSKAQGLKLALPEAKSWLDPGSASAAGAGWELRHEPTGTTVSLRRWRASRLPRIDACEAELRARTPDLASVDETNLVASREVRVPEGFVTRIQLVALPGNTSRLRGQVLAVGAGVGECFAAVARTECTTEPELAERLRLLDVSFGHIRLSHIEDRVPAPATPAPAVSP
jgi:hypothetical protein